MKDLGDIPSPIFWTIIVVMFFLLGIFLTGCAAPKPASEIFVTQIQGCPKLVCDKQARKCAIADEDGNLYNIREYRVKE